MSESRFPRIVFSERLSTGIVVHFETGVPVFFPSQFLYEQRAAQPDFREEHQEGDNPQPVESADDANYWRVVGASHASPTLLSLVHEKLEKHGTPKATNTERVSTILERDTSVTIKDWLHRVEREDELTCVPLSKEERTWHLPKLLEELVYRLRVPRKLGARGVSDAAVTHGKTRRAQGYSVPMIVEESRILQISIFDTLQNNLNTVDFSLLLLDVMAIADECDSQLKQAIVSFAGQTA
jgi:hypothetical protein